MSDQFGGDMNQVHIKITHIKSGQQFSPALIAEGPTVCGIVLNDPLWSASWMRELIKIMIQHGAVYFAFHGNRCEEAHDLADSVRDELLISSDDKIIMTTWHDNESLLDYLGFLKFNAVPSEGYFKMGPLSHLLVDVGTSPNENLVAAVREVFL
jgi:hypothetical protein